MDLDTFGVSRHLPMMPVNPETTIRKNVAMPKELWAEVRSFRFSKEIDTESEAIRRLIELGLEAAKRDAAPPRQEGME